jgi:hypothetical protein
LSLGSDDDDDNNDSQPERKQKKPNFSSQECGQDLQHIGALRKEVADVLGEGCEAAVKRMDLLQEYAASLKECEARGFPTTDEAGEGLSLQWGSATDDEKSLVASETETHGSITWERANILYNIAALKAFQASQQDVNSRAGWNKAGVHLQNASCIIQYIRTDLLPKVGAFQSQVLSANFLHVWEIFLLAEAQRTTYQTFRCLPRPEHSMLAKLAAGAAQLYQQVEDLCQESENLQGIELIVEWEDSVRAWGMWMTALTEYHWSIVHKEKKELGDELARLEGALKFGSFCKEFCESTETDILDELALQVLPKLEEIEKRFEAAEALNESQPIMYRESIPEHDELPEIAPQISVGLNQDISRLLPALSKPMFASVMGPVVRQHVQIFRSEAEKIVLQTEQVAEDKTESARKELANVDLPHSLTAYKQESNSHGAGGVPEEKWQRIKAVQREIINDQLKDELAKNKELSELAHSLYKEIEEQLDDDLQMDSNFREQNPNFECLDVPAIQKPFRQALQNYDRLMDAARDSDALLIRRCQVLDTDPKFRLIKMKREQLDRFFPAGRSGSLSGDIDVAHLANNLVELSVLFVERESFVHSLKERVKTYNILEDLSKVTTTGPNAESEYRSIIDNAKASLEILVHQLEDTVDKQEEILPKIMEENERFMRSWDISSATKNRDSVVVKIEEALEEIGQFSRHLKEGHSFYEAIIPKLETLKEQVAEASTKLAADRPGSDENTEQYRPESDGTVRAAAIPEKLRMAEARAAAALHGYRTPAGSNDPRMADARTAAAMHGYRSPGGDDPRMNDARSATAMRGYRDQRSVIDRSSMDHRSVGDRSSMDHRSMGDRSSMDHRSVGNRSVGDRNGRTSMDHRSRGEAPGRTPSDDRPEIEVNGSRYRQESDESRRVTDARSRQEPDDPLMAEARRAAALHGYRSPTDARAAAPAHGYRTPGGRQVGLRLNEVGSRGGAGSQYAAESRRGTSGIIPGVESVSHGAPNIRVDDDKVATLVEMNFDSDRAVEALRRHDNNVDRALNELLHG